MNSINFNVNLLLVLFLAYAPLSAQGIDSYLAPQLIYKDYVVGNVFIKNKPVQKALLNYNTLTEEMLFKRDTAILKVTNLSIIDSVTIEERVFIPVGDFFYERIIKAKLQLLIRNKTRWESEGAAAGYGRSKLAKTTEINILPNSGSVKILDPDIPYDIFDDSNCYVYANSVLLPASSLKSYTKLFSEDEDVLKTYLKDNKLNLKKKEDMVRFVLFINVLLNKKGIK